MISKLKDRFHRARAVLFQIYVKEMCNSSHLTKENSSLVSHLTTVTIQPVAPKRSWILQLMSTVQKACFSYTPQNLLHEAPENV